MRDWQRRRDGASRSPHGLGPTLDRARSGHMAILPTTARHSASQSPIKVPAAKVLRHPCPAPLGCHHRAQARGWSHSFFSDDFGRQLHDPTKQSLPVTTQPQRCRPVPRADVTKTRGWLFNLGSHSRPGVPPDTRDQRKGIERGTYRAPKSWPCPCTEARHRARVALDWHMPSVLVRVRGTVDLACMRRKIARLAFHALAGTALCHGLLPTGNPAVKVTCR